MEKYVSKTVTCCNGYASIFSTLNHFSKLANNESHNQLKDYLFSINTDIPQVLYMNIQTHVKYVHNTAQ